MVDGTTELPLKLSRQNCCLGSLFAELQSVMGQPETD